ncbi:MAG TPA: response regulator, partial [Acidisphaera sp.]|nr:response regulator [Acidisphaera sp.]
KKSPICSWFVLNSDRLLGLSQVHGFANQSGGSVTIDSAAGAGTTVRLFLPAVTVAAPIPALTPDQTTGHGSATVLVVEDNRDIANLLATSLPNFGYRVRIARDAVAALAMIGDGGGTDLVFTDVVMPGGMSGYELAERLRVERPDLPVLLTTGYSETGIETRQDGFEIIYKPYQMPALCRRFEALLDARRSARTCLIDSPP